MIGTLPGRLGIIAAMRRSVPVFFSPQIIGIVIVPITLSIIAFIVGVTFGWTPFTHWLATSALGGDPAIADLGWRSVAAGVIAFLAFMLLAVLAALLAIALLAMPVIVRVVSARDFPGLERAAGGTFAGSIVNAIVAFVVFVCAWLASLLLLALPPLFVAASLALSAWLNQRLLRYDALAEHASASEMRDIFRVARWRLLGLGLALAPLSYVPFVNFFAPLFAGVAFTYLCLGELEALRGRAAPRAR